MDIDIVYQNLEYVKLFYKKVIFLQDNATTPEGCYLIC